MIKRLLWILVITMMIFSAACQAAPVASPTALPPTATPEPPPPTETPEPALPVLTLTAVDGTARSFTLDELKALPATEGQAGIKSSTGSITLPTLYKGVALKDLVAELGGMDDTMGLSVAAKDGYAITYSYDQVTNGTFIAYDPATGDELKEPPALTAIIAYERDGAPLNADEEGTLRLSVVSAEPNQVTDGHWAVKWVTAVDVKSVGENWVLHLEGAQNVDVDRSTFESGASPNCHMATWTDDKAQEWVGIPLWALVGFVDDEIKHEGPAFNDALADAGYSVEIIASDGYTVTMESARVKRNDNIIVAITANGNPLPEKYYPLRLVGSDLAKDEMTGAITTIKVGLPPLAGAGEAPAGPALEPELVVFGNTQQTLELMEDQLREMEVVKISATHPKKGTTADYEGVLINTLLEEAGVLEGSTAINIVASDGFAAEVPLEDVLNCAECLLAFTDSPGTFNTVMPDMEGGTWVKDVVRIEVLPLPIAVEPELLVTGNVKESLGLRDEDLQAMEVTKISATHPKKGTTDDYEGVLVNALLEKAGVQEGATAINIVASDGYAIEVPLADVTGCAECLLAFTDETGVYNTVMPDLEGGTWVKDVVKIEVLPLPVADLSIFGLVDNPQAFSEADLRANGSLHDQRHPPQEGHHRRL